MCRYQTPGYRSAACRILARAGACCPCWANVSKTCDGWSRTPRSIAEAEPETTRRPLGGCARTLGRHRTMRLLRFARRWLAALFEFEHAARRRRQRRRFVAARQHQLRRGQRRPCAGDRRAGAGHLRRGRQQRGFGISEIALAGEHEVSREDILEPRRRHRPLLAAVPRRRADAHPAADQSVDRAKPRCSSFIPAGCASRSRSARRSRCGRRTAASR